MIKIFQKCYFLAMNIPKVHVHDNVMDFKKIFLKMLDLFSKFLKINSFENFPPYINNYAKQKQPRGC